MEGLFDTSLFCLRPRRRHPQRDHGVHSLYEAEARNKLCANIVLSGGTTMCRGFAERLHEELAGLAPSAQIMTQGGARGCGRHMRQLCAGGASFAAHPSFKDSKWIHRWIARKEYGAEPGEVAGALTFGGRNMIHDGLL